MMKCPPDYELINDDDGSKGVFMPTGYPRNRLDSRVYYCPCGSSAFEVFSPQPYHTHVRCKNCGNVALIHSG